MGDRAEVKLTYGDDNGVIFLYTHWGGSTLAGRIQAALGAGKGRWGDDSYLGRIIVSQIVGEQWAGELSFGLAPYSLESSYPDLTVDLPRQTVTINGQTMSFAAYEALSEAALERLWTEYPGDDDES